MINVLFGVLVLRVPPASAYMAFLSTGHVSLSKLRTGAADP